MLPDLSGVMYWLISGSFAHDNMGPPPPGKVMELAMDFGKGFDGHHLSYDANALHLIWDSAGINDRGESL